MTSLYLVRHASAGGRRTSGYDNDLARPLDALGVDQANGLIGLLGDKGVAQIYSSEALRCIQTVEPLAAHLDTSVAIDSALTEGQSATMAIHLARTLVAAGTTAVFASHGDIIPDMIQVLAREGMVIIGQRGWSKGSTWELRTRGGDITEAHFLGPF